MEKRITDYFNHDLSNEEISGLYPSVMNSAARYNPRTVRDSLLKRDAPYGKNGIIRYAYRPFDNRWLYWEADTKLLDEKRADYRPHIFDGNLALVSQQKPRREWSPPQLISNIGCFDLMDRGATCFPAYLRDEQAEGQQGMLDSGGAAVPRQAGAGSGGPVPPRAGGVARPGLPRGQRQGAGATSAPAMQ